MNEPVTDAHIRELLENWHADARLVHSSFAQLAFVRQSIAGQAYGPAAIRQLVHTAVSEVKADSPLNSQGQPKTSLLHDRLVENMTVREIAARHGISEATYHRKQVTELLQLRVILNRMADTAESERRQAIGFANDDVALVGRDEVMADLRARLLDAPIQNTNARTLALVGTPGVGKSTIAVALAHDTLLIEQFIDGVLFAGLGQFGEPSRWLIHWADQLGIDRADLVGKPLSEMTHHLQQAVGAMKLLVIIDDVWDADYAQSLMIGGAMAAHVITTQSPLAAHMLAGNNVIKVPELDVGQSLTLLKQSMNDEMLFQAGLRWADVEQSAVFRLCGGLPKALALLGKHMRWLIQSSQTARLRTLLDPDMSKGSQPLDALSQSINRAMVHLDDAQQNALHSLKTFHPKPNTFSDLDAMAIAGCTAEVFGALVDLGFVEVWQERFTIHSALWQAANTVDAEAGRRLVAHYALAVNGSAQQRFDIRDLENITTALDVADHLGLDEEYQQIVHNAYWLFESLAEVTLGERVLLTARRKARTDKELARIDAELARLRWYASNTPEAREQLDAALVGARQADERDAMALCYKTLSEIAVMDAKHDDASNYLAHALSNWQGNPKADVIHESAALRHAMRHSQFDAIRRFFVRAIPLAIGKKVNSEQISIALAAKAWLMYLDGQVQAARTELTRQLDDLLQNGYRLPLLIAHGSLAYIAHSMGEFDLGIDHATQVIGASDRNLSPDFTAQAYNVVALVECSRGNTTKGLNIVTQGVQYALNHQAWLMLSALRQTESTLLSTLGDLGGAANRAHHSVDLARACSNNMLAACALSQLGFYASAEGEFDKADRLFKDAIKTGKLNSSRHNPWTELLYRIYYGEHLVNRSQLQEADAQFKRAHYLAERLLSPEYSGRALIGLARIAMLQSNYNDANDLGERAYAKLAIVNSVLARQADDLMTMSR